MANFKSERRITSGSNSLPMVAWSAIKRRPFTLVVMLSQSIFGNLKMNNEPNKPPYTGSCLCGTIQYSVDKIEKQMAHCHCTMCRKFHGAAFATFGEAKTENFHWLNGKDQLKGYVGNNGTKRLFCSACGSSLIFIPSNDTGEYVEFALGTLDSEIEKKPDAHIFTNYGSCWFQITDELPQFQEGRNSAKKT